MRFIETYLVVVAYGAAYIFLAFFPSVPLRLARPIDLARFAAIYFIIAHNHLSLSIKIQHPGGLVNKFPFDIHII